MKRILAALPLLLLAAPLPAAAQSASAQAERLRDAATSDEIAYDIVEGLTTEVGARPAGSEAEARARSWAVRKLKALGFSNVHIETYDMPVWVRGHEQAEIVAPFPQKLVVTALGNSGATPPEGLVGEVVGFDSLADLEAADEAAVRGKIVFVSHDMTATQDGSQYGYFGRVRRQGPSVASRKGASAIVIRSIGTDSHRLAHTGHQAWDAGVTPIPAGALTIPDAEQLQRILRRGRAVTMRLVLTPRNVGIRQSGNVVAEVKGSDADAGIVLIGGHIDSWDQGTGAIDDAAGLGITAAAAKRIMDAARPRRTIRVVWFGAEEVGGDGSRAYFAAHRHEKVVFVAESDSGGDRIWKMDAGFAPANVDIADRVAALLSPLGISRGNGRPSAGADLGVWARAGVAAIDLQQDSSRYFDYHHTPDDTLDKVDPKQLSQNVAAWTAMLSIVANAREEIDKVPSANP
ncbi:M20/M25/M40 family metallo-hydrolase [Sphingosinicella rhizophila]|uniref:Carboxypeptidase Q n=1 Tax=Sphingosinicella rhizophila TaxID=3050082 RepID=A0ABU3Q2L3_9SPHN|nr:M20/M25/M40 family metallo-hydrolase [Sphingosinicella sp. GR2756]MDT9597641.1 M20/M25/M40 family metallo-hydrolase [Sphingosinicella sp. GR2756]